MEFPHEASNLTHKNRNLLSKEINKIMNIINDLYEEGSRFSNLAKEGNFALISNTDVTCSARPGQPNHNHHMPLLASATTRVSNSKRANLKFFEEDLTWSYIHVPTVQMGIIGFRNKLRFIDFELIKLDRSCMDAFINWMTKI